MGVSHVTDSFVSGGARHGPPGRGGTNGPRHDACAKRGRVEAAGTSPSVVGRWGERVPEPAGGQPCVAGREHVLYTWATGKNERATMSHRLCGASASRTSASPSIDWRWAKTSCPPPRRDNDWGDCNPSREGFKKKMEKRAGKRTSAVSGPSAVLSSTRQTNSSPAQSFARFETIPSSARLFSCGPGTPVWTDHPATRSWPASPPGGTRRSPTSTTATGPPCSASPRRCWAAAPTPRTRSRRCSSAWPRPGRPWPRSRTCGVPVHRPAPCGGEAGGARRADRRRPFPDALAAPEPRSPADERLERALAALPTDRREVIALKIDGGLTFREIAAVLGISPNTAASRYRYALAELATPSGGPPMTDPDLPADLAELERRLTDRLRRAVGRPRAARAGRRSGHAATPADGRGMAVVGGAGRRRPRRPQPVDERGRQCRLATDRERRAGTGQCDRGPAAGSGARCRSANSVGKRRSTGRAPA